MWSVTHDKGWYKRQDDVVYSREMCFRTKNHGRTNLLVPGLLLLLAVVGAWILIPGPTKQKESLGNGQHPLPVGENASPPVALEDAQLEGQARADMPVRQAQLPLFGSVRGKVHADSWVEWPPSILVELSLQDTGQVFHSQGVNQEEPDFNFPKVAFGNYRLTLTATGALETNVLLTISPTSPNQHMYLPLQPAASVHGTVRNAEGKAVAEIQVTAILRSDKPGRYHEPLIALTDSAGAYFIGGLRPGSEYDVFVGTFGNPVSTTKTVGVSKFAPDAWADFEIPLMGRAVITIDFPDGKEVRDEFGKVLRVLAQKEGGKKGYSQSVALSDSWQALFPALPPGEYSFSVYGGSFRRVIRSAGVSSQYETTLTIPVHHLGKGKRPR
jgi:hypothetical protein